MFGSRSKEQTNSKTKALPSVSPSINSLVVGTRIEGTINSENDIRIDGEVEGTLHCKAKVIIGPSGNVKGEIICQNAMIEGQFTGSIKVKEVLHIKEKATVEGDIHTDKLNVEPGAVFNVSCIMKNGGKKVKESLKSSEVSGAVKSNKDIKSPVNV